MSEDSKTLEDIGNYKYGFHDAENYVFKSQKGLSRAVVENISRMKGEPQWMLEFRLKGLEHFLARPMPSWGPDISELHLDDIYYYVKPTEGSTGSWDDVPDTIKNTFDKLGIPEAERKFLAGVGAQYECLSGDTRVYTARGVVPIRDIKRGDVVFSLDEEQNCIVPAPVKNFMPKGERPVFSVKVGTHSIKATENHPFLVLEHHQPEGARRGRYERCWKYLHEIKTGDLLALARSLPDVGQSYELESPASERHLNGMSNDTFHHTDSLAAGTSFRKHVNEFFRYARVNSIEPVGVEPVYDIEIDGPHNFVAEGFIVHNSEMVYHSILEHLEKQGVIFLSIEDGLRQHPNLFREYFGTVIPIEDNKFAALNSAVWSGGSFVYVPKGVKVDLPLQAYFRLNTANVGQFERSLIIVDEGASVHYVEGCFLDGAHVRTRKEEKPIEKVEVGDEVLTHLGRWRKVYHTQKRPYHGNIYKIRYDGDSQRELRVTAEHPLLVARRQRQSERNKEYQLIWSRADSVKVGDYLVMPVYQPVMEKVTAGIDLEFGNGRHVSAERHVEFPQEADFYRLLGYYFSEAHVDNERYLTFSFNAAETNLLSDARNLIERYFGKSPIENAPRQNGQTLVLTSTKAACDFAREFGSNVDETHVPEWVLNAPVELLAEFVRGLWLGDGSFDARKNMFGFNSVSANLAYTFRDALLRLGIAASVNLQARTASRKDIYTVVIASPFHPKFGALVGVDAPAGDLSDSPITLDENFLYMPIKSIVVEELETEVYNFSVEEDESYVAEGAVSHNCTAPQYTSNSFHSGVIEIVVKRGARSRYSTIQNWSHNVFNLVTQRAKVYGDATHEWVDANMGCLASGSTVTTPNGIKPIESLVVGEQVLSYDEQTGKLCFRTVTAKRFSGNQPVQTVSVGERQLRATANHPFYSFLYRPENARKRGRYAFSYVRADQLKEAILPHTSIDYGQPHLLEMPTLETRFDSSNQYADPLSMARQRSSRLTIGEYTTDELMWMFGYWVGDGNIDIKPAKTANVIRFARVGFSTPREERAREKQVLVMDSVTTVEPTERADGHHFAWNSKELVEFYRVNGFLGKASTKRVPQWVWSLPESQRIAFIAGYLDSDGYVDQQGFHIRSANRALLDNIASLLVTLGITSRIQMEFAGSRKVIIMGVECTAHGSFRLDFLPDARFHAHLSSQLQKKASEQHVRKNVSRRAVGRSRLVLGEDVEIAPVEVSPATSDAVPTWDIEVDGTGNFISQGFIVHNSKLTMKYPSCYLMEPGAHGEMLSMAFAGPGQTQDAGSKMVHFAPNTTSKIVSKSISKGGGRASYRGLLKVQKGAYGVKSNASCDALLLDPKSRSDTYPYIEIDEDDVTIGHEASVSKVGEEQLFYLMSRGLTEEQATSMVVSGFIEPLVKELPMEYAVEMNRLIQLQMEGSVG